MPYKSDAQRRFFHAAEKRGEISPQTVSEWDKASKGKKLPEYATKKNTNDDMHYDYKGSKMHRCVDRITE